jgi:hypothetical protein
MTVRLDTSGKELAIQIVPDTFSALREEVFSLLPATFCANSRS